MRALEKKTKKTNPPPHPKTLTPGEPVKEGSISDNPFCFFCKKHSRETKKGEKRECEKRNTGEGGGDRVGD